MKTIRLLIAVSLLLALTVSCAQKEENEPEKPVIPENKLCPLRVTAQIPGNTKAVITEEIVNGNPVFSTSWSVGDRCWITEYMDDKATSQQFSMDLVQSEPLTQGGNPAVFQFVLSGETGVTGHSYTYRYFASTMRNSRGYDSESNSEFYTFILPPTQIVKPGILDTNADILVSDVQEFDSRQNDLSFNFARIGTIVKLTVKGLQQGDIIESGTWLTGDHFFASNGLEDRNKYFPKEGRYKVEGGDNYINFAGLSACPLVADDNGEAVLYLRCFSGVIDDWFELSLVVKRAGHTISLSKYVDMVAASRTLQFNDGGVTMFSVTVLPTAAPAGRDDYGSPVTDGWNY